MHNPKTCGGLGICLTCSIEAATTAMADISVEEDD